MAITTSLSPPLPLSFKSQTRLSLAFSDTGHPNPIHTGAPAPVWKLEKWGGGCVPLLLAVEKSHLEAGSVVSAESSGAGVPRGVVMPFNIYPAGKQPDVLNVMPFFTASIFFIFSLAVKHGNFLTCFVAFICYRLQSERLVYTSVLKKYPYSVLSRQHNEKWD